MRADGPRKRTASCAPYVAAIACILPQPARSAPRKPLICVNSGLDERLLAAEPPVEVARGCGGIGLQQRIGRVPGLLDQRDVALQIGESQKRHARLPRAEELARSANDEVLPRDLEAVRRFVDHLEALLRGIG